MERLSYKETYKPKTESRRNFFRAIPAVALTVAGAALAKGIQDRSELEDRLDNLKIQERSTSENIQQVANLAADVEKLRADINILLETDISLVSRVKRLEGR